MTLEQIGFVILSYAAIMLACFGLAYTLKTIFEKKDD